MNHKVFLFSFLFSGLVFACSPDVKMRIYDCMNDNYSNDIANKANAEVVEKLEKCKDCCIKKTSNEVAKKYNCKVEIFDK